MNPRPGSVSGRPSVEPGRRTPAPPSLAFVQAFLNTNDIEARNDAFATPARLGRWLVGHGLVSRPGPSITEDERRWVIDVREALRDLIEARDEGSEAAGAAATLNRAVRSAGLTISFTTDGVAMAPARDGVHGAVGQILAEVPLAMATDRWRRLKVCGNDACRWVFYDSSRNRSGQWCTMSVCGNRMKARAYRARVRRS